MYLYWYAGAGDPYGFLPSSPQTSNTKKKKKEEKARSTSLLLNYSTNYSVLARKREVKSKNASGPVAPTPGHARDVMNSRYFLSLFQYLFRCFRITTPSSRGQQGRQQGGLLYLFYTPTVVYDRPNPSEFGPGQRGTQRRKA